jgi:hypothetical protein
MTSSSGSEPESVGPDSAATGLPFEVMVDDNFHYMDKDERWRLGSFATLEEARQACMALVEECLSNYYQTGMEAEELYSQYTMFGDDPFIVGPGEPGKFSAWIYAKARAFEICAPTNQ